MDSLSEPKPLQVRKTNTPSNMAAPRPLSEISPGSQRRNSPSYNQATKKMIVSRENSPYAENSSPFASKTSPRDLRDRMSPFRFDENTPDRSPSPSVSPRRRISIEKLKQSGRVKNSNIFALENKDAYDPTSLPIVERPSANRPLSQQLANNSFTRFDSLRKENNPMRSPQRPTGHKRSETEISIPQLSPTKDEYAASLPLPASPERRASPSPTKSALARTSMFGAASPPPTFPPTFDPENGTWSDEERAPTPRAALRNNKSVTFHADPPTITEYEQQTPEPSVSVGSREGSWDSDEYDDPDYSFERGSSVEVPDREDSFDEDLENADKTPVVLPEDWTRMSPDEARTDLVNGEDDVFDASPSPQRPILGRSESVTSNGSTRPLPPLPAFMTEQKRRDSGSLAAAAERASQASHNLPSPPKRASCSKDDIMNMTRESSLSLQDRLQLIGDHSKKERPESKSSEETEHGMPEEMTITNLDTGEKMDVQVRVAEAQVEDDSVGDLEDFAKSPPRISRESILRKVRNTKYDFEDESDVDESFADAGEPEPRPSYAELARMDPDQPIQSRENSRETSETYLDSHVADRAVEHHDELFIKPEPTEDDGIDLAAIPEVGEQQLEPPRSPSRMEDYERHSSVLHHRMDSEEAEEDEDASHYSSVEPEAESTMLHTQHQEADDGKESLQDAMQLLTVKDYSEPHLATTQRLFDNAGTGSFMGLPEYLGADDYDFGMKQYITPSPPPSSSETTKKLDLTNAPMLQPAPELEQPIDLNPPSYAHPAPEVSPPGTPESVIQHRSSDVSSLHEQLQYQTEQYSLPGPYSQPEVEQEIVIPERRATIKTGGKLKARPSASHADFEAMAEQRRIVSGDFQPPVPAISDAYRAEVETAEDEASESSVYSSEEVDSKPEVPVEEKPKRRESRRHLQLNLDIPQLDSSHADDLALGLDAEFERVIESQKKGYLMRQNTKVVVASNRNVSGESNGTAKSNDSSNVAPMSPTTEGQPPFSAGRRSTRSAGNSPRKPSAEQFLTTEPWNGKARRKSVRNASAQKQTPFVRETAAPPMPGRESVLGVVDEDYAAGTANLDDEVAEGIERGRLFVKVVGVKELDLPMPRNDRIYFQLTLDNGLHCVTTASLELGKNAPIGQEFELVVQEDLEFQLTLSTKLPPPSRAPATPTPSSPTKSIKSQKTGGFASRFLTSPKKRAEKERQEREAIEAEERRAQEEARRKRATIQPTAWDLLHELVNAQDGSFARSYVNLKAHEKHCFGRHLTVDVPCYNEWAQEKDTHVVNSVRSKRGAHTGPIRRPPYVVGKLELQLLYVPKPKGATDDDMPKSMGSAVREMMKAGEVKEMVHEGHLSQQGGDCAHWRRRFFRLQGARLTAYHEHTHQKRAVINLSKASRLVDDKHTLVADPTAANPGSKGRRKSAFAEEDEGYQYVEEGFRIRFANGETIDFYADSRADKERWMQVLSHVVGKPDVAKKAATWTDLVLARERAAGVTPTSDNSSSSSPRKPSPPGTDVQDFTKPPSAAVSRRQSDRRPVPKSAPTSPVKGPPPTSRPPSPPSAAAAERERARTPPMSQRRGHRARDAVKSMIF